MSKIFDTGAPPAAFIAASPFQRQGLATLLDLLVASRPCGCADPRDKLFALLGLVSAADGHIHPDYSQSVSSVYMLAAAWTIVNGKSLEILEHVCCDPCALHMDISSIAPKSPESIIHYNRL